MSTIQRRIGELIPELHEGKSFALVTDAGCLFDRFWAVSCLPVGRHSRCGSPGPAAHSALAGSGLSSRRFAFEGFAGKERAASTSGNSGTSG